MARDFPPAAISALSVQLAPKLEVYYRKRDQVSLFVKRCLECMSGGSPLRMRYDHTPKRDTHAHF